MIVKPMKAHESDDEAIYNQSDIFHSIRYLAVMPSHEGWEMIKQHLISKKRTPEGAPPDKKIQKHKMVLFAPPNV